MHLLDLPVITQSVKKHKCFQSMTIASTLTAWCNAHQSTHSVVLPSLQAPIWNNPDFIFSYSLFSSAIWKKKGITLPSHLFHDISFVSFQYLKQMFGIRNSQVLEYLQIKSVILSKLYITPIKCNYSIPID